MFDIKAFEMNDSGHLMIITRPYNGGSTTNVMVYNSVDFGQTWDSTLFLNQSMMRDNACVTEGGNLYFTTLINVYSTTNPPYQKKVLQSSLDGGITWTEKTIDSIQGSNRERSLSFINDSTGMFFYQQGMYFTNDYGQNWQHVDTIYPNSLGLLDDRFVYHGNLNLYTYEPITGDRQTQPFDPFCQGFVNQSEFHNGTLYTSLFAWNGQALGSPYSGNFASLNMDVLPLGEQKAVHFPQRTNLADIAITNSIINMILDGRFSRSIDGGNTFYDVDAFNGNSNENVRFMEFVNDTVGFLISQNLITYEWHLWKTTNGGGANGLPILTNSFTANLKEETPRVSFEVYPNPSAGVLKVRSNTGMEKATLYALDGRVCFNLDIKNTSIELDASALEKGIYVLKIIGDNGVESTQKIILD